MSTPINVSGIDLWRWQTVARQQIQMASAERAGELGVELDWLLQEVAQLDRLSLRLQTFKQRQHIPLTIPLDRLTQLWQQHLRQRTPVQYLVGVTPWRNFRLRVAPGVLIPRPETELLIDLAVAAAEYASTSNTCLGRGHWVDLGTGSGAIALGLATAFPKATVHAVDRSNSALAIAQQNAQDHDLSAKIQFYRGSWLNPLGKLRGQLTGIISNPPYIPTAMVTDLQPEVAWHEPHAALDGGADGLDALRQIITTAPTYLRSGGILLLEMMIGQDQSVQDLLHQQGAYLDVQIHHDLAGIARFAQAYRQ